MVDVRIGDGARYVAAGENVVQQLVFRQSHAQQLGLWRRLTLPLWQRRAWRQYCLGLAETLSQEEGVDHEFTELRALFSPANLPVVIEKVERRLGEILGQFRVRRVIVLGEPGSGKTTSLRHLAMLQARAAASSRRARIPMFASLGSYTGEDPVEFLQDKVLGSGRWELAVLLPKMLAQGRMILFLDALNEMPGTNYDGNIRRLRAWIESYPGNRFVFSCRTEHYRGELGIRQATVQRLTDAMIRDFAVRYRPEDGHQLFETLRRDDLMEMVRNPLILWMVLKTGITSSNRGLLIEGFVKTLLVREEGKRDVHREYRRAPSEELSRALEQLAFQSQSRYRSTMLPLAEAKALLDEGRENPGEPFDFVEQGCDALLLRFTDPRRRNLAFWHQILQEYLAAAYLERHFDQLEDSELRSLASDPWWWETLVLLSGLVEDGPALIHRLVDEESSVETLLLASALAANTRDENTTLSTSLTDRLVEKLEHGLDEATRVAATELASVAGSRFLIDLADRASGGTYACLMEAISLMVQLGDRAAIDWLLNRFEELLKNHERDEDIPSRWLQRLFEERKPKLEVRLGDVRHHFRSELPKLGGPLVRPLLKRLEARRTLEHEASDLLIAVGEPAVQVLVDYLESEVPKRMRLQTLNWLGDLRGSELAIDSVMDYLADEDPDVHWAAVRALVKLGQGEQEWVVVLKLTDKMESKNWLERLAVVGVLGDLRSDASTDLLEAATRDRNSEVRAAASTHLRTRKSGNEGLLFSTGASSGDLQTGVSWDFRTWLASSTEDIAHDEAEPLETMGLWDHIEELRLRLASSAACFLVILFLGLGAFVMGSEAVTEWVTGEAHRGPMRFWSVGLPLACTLAAGMAILWSLHQALLFSLPGLYVRERKVARRLYVALLVFLPATTLAYGALSYGAFSGLGFDEPLLVVFERMPVVLLLLTLATGLLLLVRVVARWLPLIYDQVLFVSALMLGPLVTVLGPNRIRALKLRVRHQKLLELSGSNIKPAAFLLLVILLGITLPLYSVLPLLAMTAFWLLTVARASEFPAIGQELKEAGKALRSLGPTLDREIEREWIGGKVGTATAKSEDSDESLPTMSLLDHLREARQRLIRAILQPPVVASCLWGLGKSELFRFDQPSFWDLYLLSAWPILVFQAWRFTAPGLYRNERGIARLVFLLLGLLPVLIVGLGAILKPWLDGVAVEMPSDAHLRVSLLIWLGLGALLLYYLSFFFTLRRFFRIAATGLLWVGGAVAVLWPVRLVPWIVVGAVALGTMMLTRWMQRKTTFFDMRI